MKKLFALVLALVLALSAAALGEAYGNLYINSDFGLMVSLPTGWTIQTSKDLGEGSAPGTELGSTYTLMQGTDKDGIENFIVNTITVGAYSAIMSEDLLLTTVEGNLAEQYKQLGFTPVVSRETIYFLGEIHDSLLLSVAAYGMTITQRYAVIVDGQYGIEFTATGLSAESTLTMMNGVSKY